MVGDGAEHAVRAASEVLAHVGRVEDDLRETLGFRHEPVVPELQDALGAIEQSVGQMRI